jgi:fucose permease
MLYIFYLTQNCQKVRIFWNPEEDDRMTCITHSLNSLTDTLEKQSRMNIMSGSHGFWSFGGIIGSSICSFVAGFSLVLLINPASVLAGFFIIGLGFSIIVPEVFQLASRVEGIRTSDGISVISATANGGFLTGPVLLGLIAELRTLHTSFAVLMVFVATVFVLSCRKK